MIETEGEVEGRIAVPRTFGIEEDWPRGADQDVLGRDIAVHECPLRGECVAGECHQRLGERGGPARGWLEIRLEPDRMKDMVRRKARGDIGTSGRCPVDAPDPLADPSGEVPIDPAVAELALPDRMILGSEIAHSEQAGCLVIP